MSRIRPLFPADAQVRAARLALLARRLARLERYSEALARFDQAILLDPLCAAFHDGRGVLLALLRREQEALESFASAMALAQGEQQQALIYKTGAEVPVPFREREESDRARLASPDLQQITVFRAKKKKRNK